MPLKSKSHRASIRNLQNTSRKVTIEEIEDEDAPGRHSRAKLSLDHTHTLPASDDSINFEDSSVIPIPDLAEGDGDEEDDDDFDEYELEDIDADDHEMSSLPALDSFLANLVHAQRLAEEATHAKRGKRPIHYSGNSKRSKQRHEKAHRDLANKGFFSVHEFLKKKRTTINEKSPEKELAVLDDAIQPDTGIDDENVNTNSEDHTVSTSHPSTTHSTPIECAPGSIGLSATAIRVVEQMLSGLRQGKVTSDSSPQTESDTQLENWKDFPRLESAKAALTLKSKDKLLDVLFRSRISGMAGVLNLYLHPQLKYTWREASLIVSQSQGHGIHHARNLRSWIHKYLDSGFLTLPLHRYGKLRATILRDEDFSRLIQLHLQEKVKTGYIRAQDIVDFVRDSPEMHEKLDTLGIKKKSITLRQAQRWLQIHDWRYGAKKKGMYIDGHEREDVVAYRNEFIKRWKEYEKRMVLYDDDGKVDKVPVGFVVPQGPRFRLILVTHDESTFYENDRRKLLWTNKDELPTPQRKGEGVSMMISDFLTPDWGRLKHGDEEARIVFKAGKNRDGYFTADDLLQQVDHAIDIFEDKTKGFCTGLFMFDNAPSHQKRGGDALSARKMPKGPSENWTHHKDGPKMRSTVLPDGQIQLLYHDEDHPTMPGWFKGMEQIIRERGLWPKNGLLAQCDKFHCPPGRTDCCCRRLLFTQPDFVAQKSQLEELVTSRGHLCDFYPKYHCELNFIEQYWGAAKLRYRNTPLTSSQVEMEENMLACLDDVPLVQIVRYANRSARFISAYENGFDGAEAVWVNKQFHGHRTLPPILVAELRRELASRSVIVT